MCMCMKCALQFVGKSLSRRFIFGVPLLQLTCASVRPACLEPSPSPSWRESRKSFLRSTKIKQPLRLQTAWPRSMGECILVWRRERNLVHPCINSFRLHCSSNYESMKKVTLVASACESFQSPQQILSTPHSYQGSAQSRALQIGFPALIDLQHILLRRHIHVGLKQKCVVTRHSLVSQSQAERAHAVRGGPSRGDGQVGKDQSPSVRGEGRHER